MGVRNKYCAKCARAELRGKLAADHKCFLNWTGTSSAMEANIIVDGFKCSVELYNSKYSTVIGDGDSNVYKKIIDARPYPELTVEKIECSNHLLRNLCHKIKDIARSGSNGDITARKLIISNIKRFRNAVTMATKFRGQEEASLIDKVRKLREDILNAPLNVLGEHDKYADYFCKKPRKNTIYSTIKSSAAFFKVMQAFNMLSDNAKSLLYNVNNNSAEHFNSVVAKFVGGKRINYCLRGSYQGRCNAAVSSYNSKTPLSNLHRTLYKSSPSSVLKRLEKKKVRRNSGRKIKPKKLFNKPKEENDKYYGEKAEKPDMNSQIYEEKKDYVLKSLTLDEVSRKRLQLDTTLQRDSSLWVEERRKRITASNFGTVCCRLPHTGCGNLVKSLLYSNVDTKSMQYGRFNEKHAIEHIEKHLDIRVQPCSLFVDEEDFYLGATPDGLIDNDGILEVKCPSSCKDMTPEEAIVKKNLLSRKLIKKTNKEEINLRHKHYFQVQGQLHITKRKYCLYIMWTPKGVKIEKIFKDDRFWNKEMKLKLQQFYFDCILPELVDPRHTRSMKIREPEYIIQVQNEKNLSKK
nr:uncharacterized protein LOC122271496 [Parasteatoda tepidariorum]